MKIIPIVLLSSFLHSFTLAMELSSNPDTNSISILSSEFIRLNKLKGHFQGSEYNTDIDPFNSKKHQTMIQLKELIKIGSSIQFVTDIMGKPDEICAGEMRNTNKGVNDYAPIDMRDAYGDTSLERGSTNEFKGYFVPYMMPGPVMYRDGFTPSDSGYMTLVYCMSYHHSILLTCIASSHPLYKPMFHSIIMSYRFISLTIKPNVPSLCPIVSSH